MNGVTDAYLTTDAPDDDGDLLWMETDIECPFCGHYIEWRFTGLVCDNCMVSWPDGAAVEKDRKQAERDELSDRDMFDRSLRIGGGRW